MITKKDVTLAYLTLPVDVFAIQANAFIEIPLTERAANEIAESLLRAKDMGDGSLVALPVVGASLVLAPWPAAALRTDSRLPGWVKEVITDTSPVLSTTPLSQTFKSRPLLSCEMKASAQEVKVSCEVAHPDFEGRATASAGSPSRLGEKLLPVISSPAYTEFFSSVSRENEASALTLLEAPHLLFADAEVFSSSELHRPLPSLPTPPELSPEALKPLLQSENRAARQAALLHIGRGRHESLAAKRRKPLRTPNP